MDALRNDARIKRLPIKTNIAKIKIDPEKLKEFISDCIEEFELFDSDAEEKYFWSPSLLRRMRAYEEVINKRREAANSRWNR